MSRKASRRSRNWPLVPSSLLLSDRASMIADSRRSFWLSAMSLMASSNLRQFQRCVGCCAGQFRCANRAAQVRLSYCFGCGLVFTDGPFLLPHRPLGDFNVCREILEGFRGSVDASTGQRRKTVLDAQHERCDLVSGNTELFALVDDLLVRVQVRLDALFVVA